MNSETLVQVTESGTKITRPVAILQNGALLRSPYTLQDCLKHGVRSTCHKELRICVRDVRTDLVGHCQASWFCTAPQYAKLELRGPRMEITAGGGRFRDKGGTLVAVLSQCYIKIKKS